MPTLNPFSSLLQLLTFPLFSVKGDKRGNELRVEKRGRVKGR
jgi:hypothetical protein